MLVAKDERTSPLNPSREHVVPWGLGGSDACSTMDCCVECNSRLGETVDADCINSTLMSMVRQQHGVSGYSKRVPDVLLDAHDTRSREPARIVIPPDGPAEFRHAPIVLRQDEAHGEKVLVVGSEQDVRKIVGGMASKVAKNGGRLIGEDGAGLDIEAAIAGAERESFGEYEGRFSVDPTVIPRELVKIAYGFSHLVFGHRWTGSAAAKPFRDVAIGLGGRGEVDALVTGCKVGIRSLLPMGSAGVNDHVVALLPGQQPMIIVSLFGDELTTLAVPMPVPRAEIDHAITANARAMVTIGVPDRTARWTSFMDLARHLAAGG